MTEDELIAWLRDRLSADPARVPIGIGDDAAAVRLDGTLVVITADMLLDGVHFDTARHAYELIGRKAIACSLSDCAAMACHPRAATVSVALPQGIAFESVQALYEGMAAVAAEFGCAIVGGDTTAWPGRLAIDVAMLAEPMSSRGPVRRGDARPDDTIYISGPLGGSILGKHLRFTPRLELASRLVHEPVLRAMMDISDGLALDLHRLCLASGCDAELDTNALEGLISADARTLAAQDGRAALEHALSDGEDFELLVTGGDELARAIHELRPVGRIVPRSDPARAQHWLLSPDGRRTPLAPRGYQHLT